MFVGFANLAVEFLIWIFKGFSDGDLDAPRSILFNLQTQKTTYLVDERRAPPDFRREAEHFGAARVTHALALEVAREAMRRGLRGHVRAVWRFQPEAKKDILFLDEFLTFLWCWISVWFTMEADTVLGRKVETEKLFRWWLGGVS
ncbi:Hypothetical predicted protein [Olea europaea subsp. europaea]|uniref:Uncharacterized protein n=1 Tax=Olea europaea subsp. europaea TaxID=158383 RepID=A0A8S0TKJ5_OLEEU|nr:Hypothetical predicted protein [Olea europaea subsp. europaea]